jgi:hypothetical protein
VTADPGAFPDPERVAAVTRALAAVDLASQPAWLATRAGYEERGWRPYGPWQDLAEFAAVEIADDRFAVETLVEFGYCCPCHGERFEVQNFEIRGRFENGEAIIETIGRA